MRPFPLEINRLCPLRRVIALSPLLFHFSLRSRCGAMLAGLRTLIQTRHVPDR
jgi:hypothetical protein